MTSDPNDRLENQSEMPAEQPAGLESASSGPATEGSKVPPESESGDQAGESGRRRVLIGSQRNPDAYRPKPKRDWEPIVEKMPEKGATEKAEPEKAAAVVQAPLASQPEQPPAVAAEETAPAAVPHPLRPLHRFLRPRRRLQLSGRCAARRFPRRRGATAPIRMAPLPGCQRLQPPESPAGRRTGGVFG